MSSLNPMIVLLVLLLTVAIVALVLGLIRPSIVRQVSRKRVGLIFGGATLVLFVIIGILAPSSPKSTTPVAESTAATTTADLTSAPTTQAPTAPAPQTLGQRITAYALQVYGNGISFTNTKDDEGSKLVTLNVTDIVGPATFKNHTATLSARIFQDTFKEYPAATGVSVIYTGDKTDKYGNTSNGSLMSYFISKDVFNKINWSNFQTSTLCDFLREEGTGDPDLKNGCIIFATNLQ